jgi:DnaJ-class molecular chaperone
MNNDEIKRDVDRLRYELSGKASDEDLRRLKSMQREDQGRVAYLETEIRELRIKFDDLVGVGGIERSRLLEEIRDELKAELAAEAKLESCGNCSGTGKINGGLGELVSCGLCNGKGRR